MHQMKKSVSLTIQLWPVEWQSLWLAHEAGEAESELNGMCHLINYLKIFCPRRLKWHHACVYSIVCWYGNDVYFHCLTYSTVLFIPTLLWKWLMIWYSLIHRSVSDVVLMANAIVCNGLWLAWSCGSVMAVWLCQYKPEMQLTLCLK